MGSDRVGRRWHQGTVYYERKWKGDETLEGREAQAQIAKIKKNRKWGQPYVRPVSQQHPEWDRLLTHVAIL